jgi:hypothetical protein
MKEKSKGFSFFCAYSSGRLSGLRGLRERNLYIIDYQCSPHRVSAGQPFFHGAAGMHRRIQLTINRLQDAAPQTSVNLFQDEAFSAIFACTGP